MEILPSAIRCTLLVRTTPKTEFAILCQLYLDSCFDNVFFLFRAYNFFNVNRQVAAFPNTQNRKTTNVKAMCESIPPDNKRSHEFSLLCLQCIGRRLHHCKHRIYW